MKILVLHLALTTIVGGLIMATIGCNENARSRRLGSNMNVQLPAGHKFVNATWKDNEVWYLYRPMRTNEVPETYTLKEKSSFGMIEGSVTFIESK